VERKAERLTQSLDEAKYWYWLGPLCFMLVLGVYFVARYSGNWAEADSATFAKLNRNFVETGQLVPALGPVYPNGYAFQSVTAFIVALTGLDVTVLQQVLYPLLAFIVVLPAWVLYRELTESNLGATLATILLVTQPEFLFVILRSSHEKFTRTLMLLCLFLLVRSFKLRDRPWALAAHIVAFYLLTFAFIASNNLIAHSFIVAVIIALVLGRIMDRRNPNRQKTDRGVVNRLPYVAAVSLAIVYIFTFYAYPPAQHDLLVLENVGQRIAALFLDVQTTGGQGATNAYTQVQSGWINLSAYFLVSIANWIVLAVSFVLWVRQGVRWLWQRELPHSQAAQLLWLFYAAFAAQGVLSMVSDASGALGSNLQHRLFPSFSIIAVAVVGEALARWRPRKRFAPMLRYGLAACIFGIAILSIFKATNEPLVSNKWTFYQPAEIAALDWGNAHLKGSPIWTEFDERLVVAFDTVRGDLANGNQFQGYGAQTATRNRVVTTITRLRSSRLGAVLPLPPDALLVYDNGDAQFYHLRPETPYQP
jgi:hypothetical protein